MGGSGTPFPGNKFAVHGGLGTNGARVYCWLLRGYCWLRENAGAAFMSAIGIGGVGAGPKGGVTIPGNGAEVAPAGDARVGWCCGTAVATVMRLKDPSCTPTPPSFSGIVPKSRKFGLQVPGS
jgi:hypothetical protein